METSTFGKVPVEQYMNLDINCQVGLVGASVASNMVLVLKNDAVYCILL
jgi:hypothetical protein